MAMTVLILVCISYCSESLPLSLYDEGLIGDTNIDLYQVMFAG